MNGRFHSVQKIAVLRAIKIGDFLVALPALESLRAAYPQAEIVYLGHSWLKEFLRGRSSPVDRVEVIPKYPGVGENESFVPNAHEVAEFFERMRALHFDIAIQLQGGGKNSNPFLLQLGAAHTVGLKTPDAVPLEISIPYVYPQSETIRYLEVVERAGAKVVTLTPRLSVTAEDTAAAHLVVLRAQNRPIAVLHPGASDIRRRWPEKKFSAVGDALGRAGAYVCVTGTAREREVVSHVIAGMNEPAEDLAGSLSLSGLVGLISQAKVVVSNDSGPMHIAIATGTPSAGLYWFGNLLNWGPLFRSDHRPLVSSIPRCPQCGTDFIHDVIPFHPTRDCRHEVSFVADIPHEEVAAAALELLERSGTHMPVRSDDIAGLPRERVVGRRVDDRARDGDADARFRE